jgi:GMP synthase (glutamine-hydrolysing)
MIRVLMAQVRATDDPMLAHERVCIARRLAEIPHRLDCFNAVGQEARIEMLDGVDLFLMGGSGDYSVHHPLSARWAEPLRPLIQCALDEEIPSLGICFGHQLLGHHLGCPVITDPEQSELGTVEMSLTATGRMSPIFKSLPPQFRVHTGHTDRVSRQPAGVELLATNERCELQAFHVLGTNFYSVQFHPDMTGAEARDRVSAYQDGFSSRLNDQETQYASLFEVGAGADQSTGIIQNLAEVAAQRARR